MTFARANPLGWALFEVLTSAQMNQVDLNQSRALDGYDGGDWSPNAGLTVRNRLTLDNTSTPSALVTPLIIKEGNAANALEIEALSNAGVGISITSGSRGISILSGLVNDGVYAVEATANPALNGGGVKGVGSGNMNGIRGESTSAIASGVHGEATVANSAGVTGQGAGTGRGVDGTGGTSGGNGVEGQGGPSAEGVKGWGGPSGGIGVYGIGGDTGAGGYFFSGNNAPYGILAQCNVGPGPGILAVGAPGGPGVDAIGGYSSSNGNGGVFQGGALAGGLLAKGGASDNTYGVQAEANDTGSGVRALSDAGYGVEIVTPSIDPGSGFRAPLKLPAGVEDPTSQSTGSLWINSSKIKVNLQGGIEEIITQEHPAANKVVGVIDISSSGTVTVDYGYQLGVPTQSGVDLIIPFGITMTNTNYCVGLAIEVFTSIFLQVVTKTTSSITVRKKSSTTGADQAWNIDVQKVHVTISGGTVV